MALVLFGCRPALPRIEAGGYDFQQPDMVWSLPEALNEASGILVEEKTGNFLLVQDEAVHIYEFERMTGAIGNRLASGKAADIEDLAFRDSTMVMLQSDGLLWVWEADSLRTARTRLTAESNAEGLCYAAKLGKWLIALKGDPGPSEPDSRAVYAYDLERDKMELYLRIDLEDIAASEAGATRLPALSKRQKGRGRDQGGRLDRLFAPSGIALHPQSGDCYLISAESALLAVYDPAGRLKSVHALPQTDLPKAEGIAFAQNGQLYICSEAHDGRPASIAAFFPKH